MVETDWCNMVEATTSPPTTDLSLEGFFMDTVVINSDVQLIPALTLHRLSPNTIQSYEKNIRSSKSPGEFKSAKQKQRKIPAEHRVRLASSAKIYSRLKNVKVCLERSSTWASGKTNLDENDLVYKIASPDLAKLKGKKCLADEIRDTNVGNYGRENKRRKSADTGTESIEESSERLTSKNKRQTTEIISKKTQNKDTKCTSTRAHSKRKESVRNTQGIQDTKERENKDKQEESKIKVTRSKRMNKTPSNESKETMDHGKVENKDTKRTSTGVHSKRKQDRKEEKENENNKQEGSTIKVTRSKRISKTPSNESEETVDHGKVKENPNKSSTRGNCRKRQSDGAAAIETNQEKKKLNETSGEIVVEETSDLDCNNSMLLRSSRRYFCLISMSDDEMDETWEVPSKKKKKLQKKKKNTQEKRGRKPVEKKKENTDERDAKKPKKEKENTQEKRGRKSVEKKKENTDERDVKKPKNEKENTQEKCGRKPVEKKKENTDERDAKKPKKEKENTQEKRGRKPIEKKKENTDERDEKKPKNEKENTQEKRGRKPVEKKKESTGEKGAKNPKENSKNNVNKASEESNKGQNNAKSKMKEPSKNSEDKENVTSKRKNKKESEENGNSSKVKNKNSLAEVVEKAVPKPEECVVTAKRGTLKYLKQREVYVQAVAKEAEAEDDFFCTKDFSKKRKLSQLVLANSEDDTLTIKTPEHKRSQSPNGVITPRTSLLGHWGVTQQSNTAYTPSTSSPKAATSSVEKKAIMETIYHQLKDRGGRPRGIRKILQKNESAYESILQNPQKASTLELPTLPEINDGDTSHEDEYFDTSDAF